MRSRSILFVVGLAVSVASFVAAGCQSQQGAAKEDPKAGGAPASAVSQVDRGRQLVTMMACNDCHTPWKMGPNGPEPDMSRMLSGHPAGLAVPAVPKLEGAWGWVGAGTMTAFGGPWGISYAINLTPDMETGFGVWTEQMFIEALRSGKHMGKGRPILPPMPWPSYRSASDEDLKAVFAYLQSIPPIKNKVPEATPPAAH